MYYLNVTEKFTHIMVYKTHSTCQRKMTKNSTGFKLSLNQLQKFILHIPLL